MTEWSIDIPEELTSDLKSAMFIADIADQRSNLPQNALILTLDRIGSLKVQIFSNEHPPPHFRVTAAGENNNYTISDCTPLNGNALNRFHRQICEWHKRNKQELINTWNDTRPSDCPVGQYRE